MSQRLVMMGIVCVFIGCTKLPSRKNIGDYKIARKVDMGFYFCDLDCPGPSKKTLIKNREIIYFGFSKVKTEEKVLHLLKRARRAKKINIVGYTDNKGGLEANRAVALARAKSIANKLIYEGVNSEKITISSKPKCCYLNKNMSEEEASKNRRVEVYF